jgi:ribosomal protein S18 acetylase RimI-like enzyme
MSPVPRKRQHARIRPYRPDDLDALYTICLETGDAGEDATVLHDDLELRGHVFVAPYAVLEPELCFVVEDGPGVGGYIVGTFDTRAFEERAEREWWPALRERYADPDPSRMSDWTADEAMAFLIHHPMTGDPAVVAEYPSHLHINLLPRLQGRGLGARLMDTFLDALRARGSRGVHLGVSPRNEGGIAFYRRYGFDELTSNEFQIVFALRL